MMQSRSMSLVEAITNTIVGYVLAILTQLVVFPLYGLEVTAAGHLTIGVAFVAMSLTRSYFFRRLFERLRSSASSRTSEVD
ncbi:MAG: hypothetical protein AB7G07_06770 [Bauldia sp.]